MPVKPYRVSTRISLNCFPFDLFSRPGAVERSMWVWNLRLPSIRDDPLLGRSENCQASWLCQKLMNSGKKILGLPVSIGLDWEEYGCSERCCRKSGKSTLLDLWSRFNTSADFDIFRQNQHCWIQIVTDALAGPREAWNILWIRLKSKLDGFGNSGIFCQNRKNPLKLCSGSWLGSV